MTSSVLPFQVTNGIFGALGLGLNAFALRIIWSGHMCARSTVLFLRSQCIFDGYCSLLILLYQIIGDSIQTSSEGYNKFMCLLWSQHNLFWLGIMFGLYNIVSLSLDCMLAVVRPQFHRTHQLSISVSLYVFITVMSILLVMPNFFLRQYVNSTCVYTIPTRSTEKRSVSFRIYSVPWVICASVLPIFVSLMCTGVTIQHLLKATQPNVYKEIKTTVRILVFLIVAVFIFHFPENLRSILALLRVNDYVPGSRDQQIGILLLVVNQCTNPCVLINSRISANQLVSRLQSVAEKIKHDLKERSFRRSRNRTC
ncbi:unnamed protein product [Echinostoma caproni]|uniref:G_PROTEIN_RECEP_F1_2 domain-containing protein n=1 Tax=Echinostoma caproni TaxID=27848 RepID=A0A183AVB7_9TREM|nr:unnamed protein product [Echinostoma caproni]